MIWAGNPSHPSGNQRHFEKNTIFKIQPKKNANQILKHKVVRLDYIVSQGLDSFKEQKAIYVQYF